MKFAHYISKTRYPQYQCTYQVSWKSIDVYSSYHPETKNGRTGVWLTKGRTDRHTDVQRETIIPRHHCVASIKRGANINKTQWHRNHIGRVSKNNYCVWVASKNYPNRKQSMQWLKMVTTKPASVNKTTEQRSLWVASQKVTTMLELQGNGSVSDCLPWNGQQYIYHNGLSLVFQASNLAVLLIQLQLHSGVQCA